MSSKQFFDRLLNGGGGLPQSNCCAISMFDMEMTVRQQHGTTRFFDDLTDYVNMQSDQR